MKFDQIDAREFNLAANDSEAPERAVEIADATDSEPSRADEFELMAADIANESEAPAAPAPIAQAIDTSAIAAAALAAPARRKFKVGMSWAAFGGGLASLAWIAATIGGPLSYYGFDAVMAMDPALQAGLIALAFGPSVLFWLAATAAGEAFKARRLAGVLTEIAETARLPIDASETQATRLTLNVQNEITALNDAVAAALTRLNELEAAAKRNAAVFDQAIAATRENADYMAGHLARERDALCELNSELRGQTETMANSIGRQIRLMREASKLVRTELGAAEDALESHLSSFAAAASSMAERTADIHSAAADVGDANAALHGTMNGVLDGLGEATRLTDAARQSAHQATLAATETAQAVRETTKMAVIEAKRAAEVIREETAALQDAAAETLARLAAAAEAARAASEESQAAADRHASSIEKRLAALAQTAKAAKPRAEKKPEPQAEPAQRAEEQSLHAVAAAAVSRGAARAAGHAEARSAQAVAGRKGFSSWTNLFAMPERAESAAKPAGQMQPETADAFDLVDFGSSRKDPDAVLKADVLALIISAGVDLDRAFQSADLDRIAQRSREGAGARRRAVQEAAPAAVARVARQIKRDRDASLVAGEFRARPDLATSERKGGASELVRAYLLIDAALS